MRSLLDLGLSPAGLSIAKGQVDLFHNSNDAYVSGMVRSTPARYPMGHVYSELISKKKLTPVDKLSEEEMRDLWQQTQYYADGKLGNRPLTQLMIVLYTLNFLL